MIGRTPPCPSKSFLRLLALLLLVSAAPLAAATALTNGHPIFVSIPEIEEEVTLLAGDDSFTIFVPEGATRLVVEFVTSPTALIELAVEFGQDVGSDGIGNLLGGRPSIRLARYFPWIEMRAGDLLVRQRQGAGWRSGGASANTATKSVQRRFSAPLGSFDELFGRPCSCGYPWPRVCIFKMLCVRQIKAHSPRTFSSPRKRNPRIPRPCLI